MANKNKIILITGSLGLIGLESSLFYLNKGYGVVGIDNNLRKYFFGKDASTSKNLSILKKFKKL